MIIEAPHLPQGRVTRIIIGKKYRNQLANALKAHDIDIICAADNPYVDERLSGHIDLSAVHLGKNRIAVSEYLRGTELADKLSQLGFDIDYQPNPIEKTYPHDAVMNVCIVGDRVICNPKTAIPSLSKDREALLCKQGYTKCSTVVVDGNAIITSDNGIAKAATQGGLDVLLINDDFVQLPGFPKGFIGGAAFKLSKSELAFTGQLPDEPRKEIESFLAKRNIQAVYLTEYDIFDIGSAIPVTDDVLTVTDRINVRRFRKSDTDALHGILSDPEVMRYIEPPYTLEQTAQFIRDAGLCEPPLVLAIEERSTGNLIGQLIYHPYDETNYELGWILAKLHWNTGIAQELTAAMIEASKAAGIAGLIIECAPEQNVSRHIAEKTGFTLIHTDELLVYYMKL